jgi:hypothetical protein
LLNKSDFGGGSLTLRDYDGQVAEAMALVRALNKMTKAGMPESIKLSLDFLTLQGNLACKEADLAGPV